MIWNYGIIQVLDERLSRAAGRATRFLVAKIKEAIDAPFPPESEPGEPPHKRSGELEESVHEVRLSRGKYQIVVSAPHGYFLEFGTSTMEPRPFFVSTVKKHLSEARRIIVLEAQKQGIGE